MDAVETLTFFHILFVLVFFSGTIVSTMAMMRAERETNVQTVKALTKMSAISQRFLIELPVVVLGVLGVFLAREEDLSLTDTGWLNAAYAATALGLLLSLFVMGRQSMRAAKLAERDAAAGQKSAELQAVLSERLPKAVGGALHGLVVYILVLMVYKPF